MATPNSGDNNGAGNAPPRASAVSHRTTRNTPRKFRNPRPAGAVVCTPLSNTAEKEQMLSEMKGYVARFNLNPAGVTPVLITTTLKGDKRGNREKEMQTVAREYQPKWEEFARFSWLVGDVGSAVICCDALRPPKAMPSTPETLALFMQYKVNEAHEPVLYSNGQHAIYKRGKNKGKRVVGVAHWSHPVNLRKFRVAIKMVHRPFNNCRNQYESACDDCITASEQNPDGTIDKIDFASPNPSRQYRACIRCGIPRILPRGDPTTSAIFESCFNSRETHCENEHVIKGCLALSVKQTRTIRRYLLSDGVNKLRNLQLWTLLLVAIRCFLRCDEVASIDISDFAIRAIELNKERKRVEHLALWVRGKGDKQYVLLSLWRDDENPEFCPVRAVLIYLAAANLSGGCLFPRYEDLEDHHVDKDSAAKSFEHSVTYGYIRTELKKAIDSCFGGDEHAFPVHECKVGTHTMRKTAYLFAVFSVLSKYDLQGRAVIRDGAYRIQPLEMDDIEKAARHGNHQSSALYFAANSNKYERFGPSNDAQWPHHRVSPWRSVYYCSSKSKDSYPANEDLTTRTDWPIQKISHWFVCEELGVTTAGWDPIQAIEVSCRLRDQASSAIEQFNSLLMSHLPTALYRQAKELFQECCKEVQKQHDEERHKRKQDIDSNDSASKKRKTTVEDTPLPPKNSYEAEMKALQDFKRENKEQKKLVLDKIMEMSMLPTKNTTKKARTWLTKLAQTARCAQYCVANCHGGDWHSWESSMRGEVPIGGYQKWKCQGCNAKMNEIKKNE